MRRLSGKQSFYKITGGKYKEAAELETLVDSLHINTIRFWEKEMK